MNPEILIPIISVISVFGSPVAIIYVLKHFKLKERELALEAGGDHEERVKKLETRLEQMERRLGTVEKDVRALPAGPSGPAQLPPARRDPTPD